MAKKETAGQRIERLVREKFPHGECIFAKLKFTSAVSTFLYGITKACKEAGKSTLHFKKPARILDHAKRKSYQATR